jgi:hypothetical protein
MMTRLLERADRRRGSLVRWTAAVAFGCLNVEPAPRVILRYIEHAARALRRVGCACAGLADLTSAPYRPT